MMGRFMFMALCFATASAALGQNVRPTPAETHEPRPIAKKEGRKILTIIPAVAADVDSESETDCSHLVHDVYEQAGFSYDYVSSNELYIGGNINFTRVRVPQAGDLVVWRGHAGIVIDPKEHSFFSFLRSGPDTQFYDSPYWRSRGIPRFFRYMSEKPLHAGRTLEAAGHEDHQSLQGDSRGLENHPPSKVPKLASVRTPIGVSAVDTLSSPTVEPPRAIVLQMEGEKPSQEEVVAAFVEMNQDSGESLRTHSLNNLGKKIVIYRELRVSAMEINGKRGAALVSIEELSAPAEAQAGAQFHWQEQPLEFEKTKRAWVMNPIEGPRYVKREVALQVLSSRLANLAKHTDATSEQEREQRQIVRLLNSLITDNSAATSAQNN